MKPFHVYMPLTVKEEFHIFVAPRRADPGAGGAVPGRVPIAGDWLSTRHVVLCGRRLRANPRGRNPDGILGRRGVRAEFSALRLRARRRTPTVPGSESREASEFRRAGGSRVLKR